MFFYKRMDTKTICHNIIRKRWFLCAVIIALLMEFFIFNYQHWCTRKYVPIQSSYEIFDGIQNQGEYYELSGDDKASYGIEFKDLDCVIHNIHIKVSKEHSKEELAKTALNIKIYASDQGNANPRQLPERTVVEGVTSSEYIKLDLNGKCKELRILFDEPEETRILIDDISLNVVHPFLFSKIRFGIVFIIISILLGGSRIWSFINNAGRKTVVRSIIILVFIAAHIFLYWEIAHMNPFFKGAPRKQDTQYWELTDSFISGQTWLKEVPPEELISLDNPYDRYLRESAVGYNYFWDTAYYNGKYFVYFGVGPVILFYLPFKLLFHRNLPHFYIIYFCSIMALCAMMRIIWLIRKRFYPDVGFVSYLLTCLFAVNSCGTILLLKRTDFYSVPVISGLMFSLTGLALILSTEIEKKRIYLKTTIGAVCLAFVAACRPQFLISSFLLLFILNINLKDKECIFRKKRILCIIIPYVIIAACLMHYNAIRFGSPFDFGANYNLTTNDMTSRGFSLGRIGFGLFEFLLHPINFSTQFPFLSMVNNSNLYMGTTIIEKMYGGVLMLNPLLFLCLSGKTVKENELDRKALNRIRIFLFIASIAVVVLDTQMAGVLERYQADFLWLLTLASIPAMLYYMSRLEEHRTMLESNLLKALFAVFIINSFLQLFVTHTFPIRETNPQLFYLWFHRIQFWL